MEAALFHGSLPFIMDGVAVSRGGRGALDSFRARLLCTDDWENDARTLGFEIDKRMTGFSSLWVKSLEPDYQAETVVTVDVSGEGLATIGDRRQRKMKCGEQETSVGPNEKVIIVISKEEVGDDPETPEDESTLPSGDPAFVKVKRRVPKLDDDGEPVLKDIVTGSGIMKRWVVSEAEVTLIDTYFTTTKPVMSVVGQSFAPVNPPDIPPYQWGGYTEPLRGRHPNGWVLADRDVDEIFYFSDAIGLWRVTDTIVFRQQAFPE